MGPCLILVPIEEQADAQALSHTVLILPHIQRPVCKPLHAQARKVAVVPLHSTADCQCACWHGRGEHVAVLPWPAAMICQALQVAPDSVAVQTEGACTRLHRPTPHMSTAAPFCTESQQPQRTWPAKQPWEAKVYTPKPDREPSRKLPSKRLPLRKRHTPRPRPCCRTALQQSRRVQHAQCSLNRLMQRCMSVQHQQTKINMHGQRLQIAWSSCCMKSLLHFVSVQGCAYNEIGQPSHGRQSAEFQLSCLRLRQAAGRP